MAGEGRIDRVTAEEVLRLALAREAPGRGPDDEGLTADQLVAIAAELGVSEAGVRTAFADVLDGTCRPTRRMLGAPVAVTAERAVGCDDAVARARINAWLEYGDGMRQLRDGAGGATVWGRRGGVVEAVRTVDRRLHGEPADMRRAHHVVARVRPFGEDSSVVSLDADARTGPLLAGWLIGLGLAACAVLVAFLTVLVVLIAVPVAVVAGAVGGALGQRAETARLGRAVEARLSAVASDAEPPQPTSLRIAVDVLGRAAKSLRPHGTPPPPPPPGTPRGPGR